MNSENRRRPQTDPRRIIVSGGTFAVFPVGVQTGMPQANQGFSGVLSRRRRPSVEDNDEFNIDPNRSRQPFALYDRG
jgi:hypothetical protein